MHIGDQWMQLHSHDKTLDQAFDRPFPVGVEYYRPPVPPPEYWDEDFRRISAAGMSIVRVWYSWDWVETLPNHYEFDDLDRLFDLAAQHGLKVWVDTPLGTHMACPAWMLRAHPDMRIVRRDGSVQQNTTGAFAAHGAMTHNFDHPMWRVYVERYLRQFVPRYKDHQALGVWGTWDGIGYAGAWTAPEPYPPYNDYTIAKYKDWLYRNYTLDALNERLLRRYRSWEDVDAPRSKAAPVEMRLYLQFHRENMADHLGWMADLIDRLDGTHEQRSHGGSYPAPHHETVSPQIDSWGLSHHSSNRLTTDEPYSIACEAYGFQWCRAMGRNNRWWNEEIYGSFVGGLHPTEKKTLGEESALYIWLTLIEGGAGAMFWQYRPEYMTYEAPGLNIAALDGEPTERLHAATATIAQIDRIAAHLPLSIPRADVAIAYSGPSDDAFDFNDHGTPFIQHHRALYRTLWA
ncbi:MAG: beta-galactosidase, partial [Gemmatimonadetes bacterium]|nr:beta-galactosidase [Gemmatimonadota bacterium]